MQNAAVPEKDTQDVAVLDKIPLTPQLYVNCINAGKKPIEIAALCHISRQAVSDYKIRHWEEIEVLLDKSDSLLSVKAKLTATRAMEKIDTALDGMEQKDARKHLMALNAISGTHIEKFRLLEGKSTDILDITTVSVELQARIETSQARIQELRDRLERKKSLQIEHESVKEMQDKV